MPLSDQPVGDAKVDQAMKRYVDALVANGKARLDAVRRTTEAAEFLARVRADEHSKEVRMQSHACVRACGCVHKRARLRVQARA